MPTTPKVKFNRNNNTRRPPSWWGLQQHVLALWFAIQVCVLHQSEFAYGQQQRQRQQSGVVVDLPFGEINVLVLTDTHSWIGGHSNEPKYNADYGDVLSFYQRLHDYCQENRMDLWFVVNGDWIDGTGLSLGGDISYLTPLLEKMDWDALNVGNHELYRSEVIHESMRPGGFVESWGDRYLSSNVLYAPQQRPLGKQYRFLRGRYNATVLTFGFLYNMDDASDAVIVKTVESVIEEQWFIDVLTNPRNEPEGKYDAIMVLAHMDVKDQLVTTLLSKIRSLVGKTMPVQFITGHTHIRDVHTMDDASNSFEAGKFLDTLGFVSFPSQKTVDRLSPGNRRRRGLQRRQEEEEEEEGEGETPELLGPGGTEWPNVSDSTTSNSTTTTTATTTTSSSSLPATNAPTTPTVAPTSTTTTTTTATTTTTTTTTSSKPTATATQLFRQKFIDTDVPLLESILGVPSGGLSTEDGSRLSEFIFRTRSELGLLDLYGCTSKSYYMNRTIDAKDSVWKLFVDEVAPYQLLKPKQQQQQQQARLFLGESGGLRYDLLGTQIIKDDIIAVSPFNESIIALGPNISGAVVTKLVEEILNKEENPFDSNYANYVLSPPLEDIETNTLYEIMVPRYGLSKVIDGLKQIKYNGTVHQEESEFFSTDLWLRFVQDNWKCKENDNTQSQEHHTTGSSSSHGHNSGGGSNHHTGSSSSSSSGHGHGKGVHSGAPKYYYEDDAAEDKRRTIMASIALACVAFLGTLYIWQLHRDWLAKYHERQRLIFLADEENGHDNELI